MDGDPHSEHLPHHDHLVYGLDGQCGSLKLIKCRLDNQGKEGVGCAAVCQELCECAGLAGFGCPYGYECIVNSQVVDALGYCE